MPPINRGRINSAIKIRSSSISSSSFSWDFALVCGLHGNLRGATRNAASQIAVVSVVRIVFVISIHAPREGSDQCEETLRITITVISIHAPREGSDPARSVDPGEAGISIHAPREGSDLAQDNPAAKNTTFQSTLPARGATKRGNSMFHALSFQSTLPARGATRQVLYGVQRQRFQSTLPVRGATRYNGRTRQSAHISIHAPREGSDTRSICSFRVSDQNFNPRSP